jgi:hypothetical protein
MPELNPNVKLYQKLHLVQQEVKDIPTTGWNSFSKYAYPTFKDILNAVKPTLKNHHLFVYFSLSNSEAGRTADGKKNYAYCETTAYIVDCDTGETLSSTVPCYAEDTSDKAAYQINTNGKKYSLLTLLGLNVGEDQESDANTQTKSATKSPKTGGSPAQSKPRQNSII